VIILVYMRIFLVVQTCDNPVELGQDVGEIKISSA
jgi:hypothetical protein